MLVFLVGMLIAIVGLASAMDKLKAEQALVAHFRAGWERCYASLLEVQKNFETEQVESDEHYELYSKEFDEHGNTQDALDSVLATNNAIGIQLDIKNKHIAKLNRTLTNRDDALRAIHARVEMLTE